jgi:membrane peptidoglycan carboxypeptidase
VTPGCEIDQTTAFFCDYVVWTIRNSLEFGQNPEDREMLLRRGGLEIYTTLDLDLQQTAWDSVMDRLPADNEYAFGTAGVSVEVGTGRIVTMAQNRFFDQTDEPGLGRTSVNFNTDKEFGGSSGFQSGSTYKVFTLAEWLKQGHTLQEHVDGRVTTGYDLDGDGELDPKIWDVATQFTASCGGVGGTWEVNNSGDKTIDDISVLQAVITSQNTAFAAMASQLDLCGIRDTAMDFGVRRSDGTELQYVPASILGVNEVSPLSMASAFAAIANDGVYCSPVAIDKVVRRSTGEELAVPESLCNQAVTPDIAAAMEYAMKSVMTGGTGSAANTNDGTPLAGKTGTTDDRIHTWMVGFSTEVATAVWVGNVKGQVRQGGKSINGMAVTVIRHAIWKDIMKDVNAKYGGDSFRDAPSNLISAPTLTVPEVGGMDAATAEMQIKLAGFSVGTELQPVASSQPIGAVAYTVPAVGESVPKGTLVKIFISSGGATLMPDVSGMDIDVAADILANLGLITSLPQPSQGWLYNKCDPNLPDGVVFGTDPAAGTEVANASAVVLIPNDCSGGEDG